MYRTRLVCVVLAFLCSYFSASLCKGQSMDAVIKELDIKGAYQDAILGHANKLIVDLGSMKVDQQNSRGLTLLDCAIMGRQLELTKILVEKYHANVNEIDGKNFSPIHYAAAANALTIIKYLAKKGANINKPTQNSLEDTALIITAGRGFNEAVAVLLDHGADPFINNGSGETAKEFAKKIFYIFTIEDVDKRNELLKQASLPVLRYRIPIEMQDRLSKVIQLLEYAEKEQKRKHTLTKHKTGLK